MMNEYDDWNKAKRDFQTLMTTLAQLNPLIMGIGVPMRHPSYILGRPLEHSSTQPQTRQDIP
jgi:hypothetical protein